MAVSVRLLPDESVAFPLDSSRRQYATSESVRATG